MLVWWKRFRGISHFQAADGKIPAVAPQLMPLRADQMPQTFFKTSLALAAFALVFGSQGAARAEGKWTVDFKANAQNTLTEDEKGTLVKRSREKDLNVKLDTQLMPTFDMSASLKFNRKNDDNDNEFAKEEDKYSADAQFKADWWNLDLGYEETQSESGDPSNPKDLAYTAKAELKIEPEHDILPRLNYKYSNTDSEIDNTYMATFEYELAEMLKFKAETERGLTDVKDPTSNDKDSRKFRAEAAFDMAFLEEWKVELKGSTVKDQQLSLSNDGLLMEEQNKITNELNGKVSDKPLEWVDLSFEAAHTEDKDLVEATPTQTKDSYKTALKMNPKPTSNLDLELGYSNNIEQNGGTDADSTKVDNEYNLAATWEIFSLLKLDASYDRKNSTDDPEKAGEITATTRDDDYKVAAEMGVWEDQIALKAERTYKYGWKDGEMTSSQSGWNVTADATLDDLPNMEFTPTYTLTSTHDHVAAKLDDERKLEAQLAYKVELEKALAVNLDHTYSRTDKRPGDATPNTITREDTTKITAKLTDFLQGMALEAGWERNASDQSLDDKAAEIDYKYTLKYTWDIRATYKLSLDYAYSKNQVTDDEESFLAEVVTSVLNDKIELTLSYDYNQKYGGVKSKEQTYLIEIGGKF